MSADSKGNAKQSIQEEYKQLNIYDQVICDAFIDDAIKRAFLNGTSEEADIIFKILKGCDLSVLDKDEDLYLLGHQDIFNKSNIGHDFVNREFIGDKLPINLLFSIVIDKVNTKVNGLFSKKIDLGYTLNSNKEKLELINAVFPNLNKSILNVFGNNPLDCDIIKESCFNSSKKNIRVSSLHMAYINIDLRVFVCVIVMENDLSK